MLILSCQSEVEKGQAKADAAVVDALANAKKLEEEALAKAIIPCEFDEAGDFNEGVVVLRKGTNWYYYDIKGQLVIDMGNQFTYCGSFYDVTILKILIRLRKLNSPTSPNRVSCHIN